MKTYSLILSIILLLVTISCFSKRKVDDMNNPNVLECAVYRSPKINFSEIPANKLTEEFIQFTTGIQILKIETNSGYDIRESINLFITKNNQMFRKTSIEYEDIKIDFSKFLTDLENIKKESIVVACKVRGSNHKTTKYFLKSDGKIISSLIISGNNIDNVGNNDEIQSTLMFFDSF